MASTLVRRVATLATAATFALMSASVLPGTAAQAAPATVPVVSSTTVTHQVAVPGAGSTSPRAGVNAGHWDLVGVFPDPITCAIAGATTGRSFYCGFYFFFWGLNVWTP